MDESVYNLGTISVPGTIIASALYIISNLIFTKTLRNRYYYEQYFTDDKTEVRQVKCLVQDCGTNKQKREDWNLSSLAPEFVL